jgi:hypothetical protein
MSIRLNKVKDVTCVFVKIVFNLLRLPRRVRNEIEKAIMHFH